MAISLGTGYNSGNTTSATGVTFSATMAANTKCMVVVVTGYDSSATDSVVNSVVFNTTESLIQISGGRYRVGSDFQSIWYKVNPSITTANVVVTMAGTCTDVQATAIGLIDASASSIVYDSYDTGTATGSASGIVSPAATGSYAVGGGVAVGGTPASLSITTGAEISGSEVDMGSQTASCGTAAESGGSATITWTYSAVVCSALVATFKPENKLNISVSEGTAPGDSVKVQKVLTGINYDNYYSTGVRNALGLPISFSFTTGNYTDRIMIMATSVRGNVSVSNYPTYNGTNLTSLGSKVLGTDIRVELWYLLSPTVGTNTFSVTFSGDQNIAVNVATYYRVSSITVGGNNSGSLVTTASTSNTNTTENVIVDILGLQSGGTYDITATAAGEVARLYEGAANMKFAYGDILEPTANESTGWSFGSNYYSELAGILTATLSPYINISVSDGTAPGDKPTLPIYINKSDGTAPGDSVVIPKYLNKLDSTTPGDSVSIKQSCNISVQDGTIPGDICQHFGDAAYVGEVISINLVTETGPLNISVEDGTQPNDSLIIDRYDFKRTVEVLDEGVSALDSAIVSLTSWSVNISVSDGTVPNDSVNLPIYLNIQDSTAPGDSLVLQTSRNLNITENTTPIDSVLINLSGAVTPLNISVVDGIYPNDSAIPDLSLDLMDWSNNTYDLTNNNGIVKSSSGYFNNAASSGTANTDKSLGVNSNLGFTVNQARTYTCWVKMNTELSGGDSYGAFLSQAFSTEQVCYGIGYYRVGGVNKLAYFRWRAGVGGEDIRYTVNLGTSTWHHVAFTLSGTTLSGYIDGASAGTPVTINTGNGSAGYVNGLYLFWNNGGNYLSCLIDEATVWNYAKTEAEISASYLKELSGKETSLVALYPFGEPGVKGINVSDGTVPGDSVTVSLTTGAPSSLSISVSDSTTPNDTVTIPKYLNIQDGTQPNDSLAIYLNALFISVLDGTIPGDLVNLPKYLNLKDSTTPNDTVIVSLTSWSVNISVLDSTTPGDLVNLPNYLNIQDGSAPGDIALVSLTTWSRNISVSDDTAPGDSVILQTSRNLNIIENTTPNDSIIVNLNPINITIIENTIPGDTTFTSLTGGAAPKNITVFDGTAPNDLIVLNLKPLNIKVSDGLTSNDSLTLVLRPLNITIQESMVAADSLSLQLDKIVINSIETTSPNDSISVSFTGGAAPFNITVADGSAPGDSVKISLNPSFLTLEDGAYPNDTVILSLTNWSRNISVIDGTNPGDTALVSLTTWSKNISVSDGTTPNDAIIIKQSVNISVSDGIVPSDSATIIVKPLNIKITDNTTLNDIVAVNLSAHNISVRDSITPNDSVAVTLRYFLLINTTDSTTVGDIANLLIPAVCIDVKDSTRPNDRLKIKKKYWNKAIATSSVWTDETKTASVWTDETKTPSTWTKETPPASNWEDEEVP